MVQHPPARERPARTGGIERVSALLEVALGWLVCMALGAVLIGAVLQASQVRELHALRLDRIQHLLISLRERLEADMSSGLDLSPGSRAQARLEETLADDSGLRGIDVVGADGRVRLGTELSAVGDALLPALGGRGAAPVAGQETWVLAADPATRTTWLATTLADAAGQFGGRLVVSYAEPADALSQSLWHWVALAALGLPAGCALLLLLRPQREQVSPEVEQALARLRQTRQRLHAVAEELKALEDAA